MTDDLQFRKRRIAYRAWHRGTKEADLLIGGFADRYMAGWGDGDTSWFEALIEEQDVDIMAWAIGSLPVPEQFQGPMMSLMQRLDYIGVAR